MSLDPKDIATIHALIADALQTLHGDKGTGLDLGETWRASQGQRDQIPGRVDEPMIDPDVASVLRFLPPPGEITEKLGAEDLAPLPSDEVPEKYRATRIPPLSQVWMGRVVIAHDAAVDPTTGQWQTIQVIRVHGHYDVNNEPYTNDSPMPPGDSSPFMQTCYPLPMRHDQQKYNVAEGELVAVFVGNDGRHYYMRDDLPFVASVIKRTALPHEDQAGGVGLLSLSVRRQSLSGDPAAAPVVLADLLDAGGSEIEYTNVLVIGSVVQQHGYRVGDKVWVQRRGGYYFVTSGPDSFMAYLVTRGPTLEVDFTDERYWVREVEATITYTDLNIYTYVYADRSLVDPTGSGGRMGRWCPAVNVADTEGDHGLPLVVAGNPTTGYIVEVTVHGDPATGEAWYTFSAGGTGGVLWGKATADWAWDQAEPNQMTLDPCTPPPDPPGGVDNGLANVTGHLITPISDDPGQAGLIYDISTDDILAYIPFGVNQGIIVNAHLRQPDGVSQYQVWSWSGTKWFSDWVRAH